MGRGRPVSSHLETPRPRGAPDDRVYSSPDYSFCNTVKGNPMIAEAGWGLTEWKCRTSSTDDGRRRIQQGSRKEICLVPGLRPASSPDRTGRLIPVARFEAAGLFCRGQIDARRPQPVKVFPHAASDRRCGRPFHHTYPIRTQLFGHRPGNASSSKLSFRPYPRVLGHWSAVAINDSP